MIKIISSFFLMLLVVGTSYSQFTQNKDQIKNRFERLLDYPVDSIGFPRSMSLKTESIKKVPSKDWTSGFFVGNLWQIYQLTGDIRYKERAAVWNPFMEKEKFNAGTHDIGFKIFCSYGKGLEVAPNKQYEAVIIKSAQTLISRFNPKVGSLRSWDFNKEVWNFPVIIDNMLNLELLFEASKISGDSKYKNIAIAHANTTLKNHFRKDDSCFHVVDYEPNSGAVRSKVTHQGFNNESAWARGQGWAIYGFTMCYRYTKDKAYLKRAEATAKYFINHKNMPEDGIPYWDFVDPSIPNSPRDASAGALVASALIELYTYTNKEEYLKYANKVLNSLSSDSYLLDKSIKGPFILDHSTGNWPKNDEIDEPIVYGDYYFLEAIIRIFKANNLKF